MSFTAETRVRLVDSNETAARALRNLNIGAWILERRWLVKGSYGEGFFVEISSHISQDVAEKAKARLDKKIAKG